MNEIMTLELARKIDKRKSSLRYWLLGKGFYKALDAMEFGASYHTGFRKDGVTPEFDHQISIAHYVRTLPDLMYLEETLCTVFLHDVREDFSVEDEVIRQRYGDRVADAVWCMTKIWKGVKRDEVTLFREMALDPIASIAKGGDRGHNYNSMVGVFTQPKQVDYIAEGERLFIPMLKAARRNFPQQEPAYENIKHLLTTQIALIKATLPPEMISAYPISLLPEE